MGGCCSCSRRRNITRDLQLRGDGRAREDQFRVIKFHDPFDDEHPDGARVWLRGSPSFASMYSQQGWKGINQDAMTIWEDFGGARGRIFCGVFDGHGQYGHRVASYVRDNLPLKLYSRLSDNINDEEEDESSQFSSWRSTLAEAFEELDEQLGNHAGIDCICSGTTAVTIVKQGDHLMIANLGDSRAVICSRDDDNQLVPEQLTVDLKPNLPSEAERITGCRGRVFAMEEEPDVHRVWLPDEDSPGLAMARAFGDFCLKDFGLISTPQVSYRKLTDMDEFVVLATDGVWDVLSNKEVVKIVSTASKRSDAARHVVKQAVRTWRSKHPASKVDDCAVVCLFLKPQLLSAKSSFNSNHHPTRSLSFTDSFKTAGSEEGIAESDEAGAKGDGWTALEGVSRANSLMKVPRFASVASALSWRKRSVKLIQVGE